MDNVRRWEIDASGVYVPYLAADVRRSRTNYLDDQIWSLSLGGLDVPALSLETRYGGRVALASILPIWGHDGRSIQHAQTYADPPIITRFAPGYMQAEARITLQLDLQADYVVFESAAIGGRFTLTNTGQDPVELRLDLFAHVASERRKIPLAILTLVDEINALSMGRMPGFEPVLLLEGADAEVLSGRAASPKIGTSLMIPAGERVSVRWVHVGLPRMAESLERARFWLAQDWDALTTQIDTLAATMPQIETGDNDLDAAIAFSYQQMVQAFIGPADHLPNASFVGKRMHALGFSVRGDGTDYGRGWDGQDPFSAYLLASAVAVVDPQLAQGIIYNFLAVQEEDGSIDAAPGLGGQRAGILSLPLLARLTWNIYQQTGDKAFVEDVYADLLVFFNRWFEQDLDYDLDQIPEWQDERQTGYIFWPTFAAGQVWSQGVDIRRVETPDLAAYLISEAEALQHLIAVVDDPGAYEMQARIQDLLRLLDQMWYVPESRYAYQDRDTGTITTGRELVQDVRGDEEQILAMDLDVPSRVIVRVSGGTGRVPNAELTISGVGFDGNSQTETVPLDQFAWRYGAGNFTSAYIYKTVDRIVFTGLSRVFRFSVRTVDFTRLDLNAAMPLIAAALSVERAQALTELLGDGDRFLRPNGLTLVAADDPGFDPASANGGGGVWAYWTTLIGESLLQRGKGQLALELFKRLVNAQITVLKKTKQFSEFYHADEALGLGDEGRITGAVPLYLLSQLIGVTVHDGRSVTVRAGFAWADPVTVKQHGVTVRRDASGADITFASGHVSRVEAGSKTQRVTDPTTEATGVTPVNSITPPETTTQPSTNRVIIEVEHDETNGDT